MTQIIKQQEHRVLKQTHASGIANGAIQLIPAAANARTLAIALTDVAAGLDGSTLVGPVIVELPKNTSDPMEFLEVVHWAPGSGELVNAAGQGAGTFFVGQCVNPDGVLAAAATCLVRLTGDPAVANQATG